MSNRIFHSKPADFNAWESHSFPIGNGYMGATFFGGIAKEKIVLNEKTLWKGGPSKWRPDYKGGNKYNSYSYVKQVQTLLAEGKYNEAKELLPHLTGDCDGAGNYLLLCDAYLDFHGIDDEKAEDYCRYLDMSTATSGVKFTHDGIAYERSFIASYPARAMAFRFTAGEKASISFTLSVDNIQNNGNVFAENNTLAYFGEVDDNQLRYYAIFKVVNIGGAVIANGDKITVEDADEVVIFFSTATDFADTYPEFRSGIDPKGIAVPAIDNAEKIGYDAFLKAHLDDYKSLFDRVKVSLNSKDLSDVPTDVLLENYKKGCQDSATYLEELYFQFGRYVLISSSREGSLPANLQGVWNESNNPPWGCDYHINVNLQMNYWGAYNTNLAETAKPLVAFLESLRKPGRITAKEYYNIVSDENNPENGWTAHTQSTPFGWTSPGWDFYWGWSTAAVAWLMQNIWEYYEFTEDKDYFKDNIYPIMRESAVFYKQWLIYDEKQQRLVSSPTYSPEQGPVTIGDTYEQSLIEQAFIDFVKASEVLELDESLRNEIKAIIPQLKPFKVGKWGQIMEWFEEDDENFDNSKVDPHHRHVSHLMGLYPGKAITPDNKELLDAAIVTLNARGDESTGWARAYKLNLWARIGDGNRAYKLLHGQIADCTFPNLFDFHPPFQLDGNFGGSAGIAEMLIQSHRGFIDILPSIPDNWSEGEFSGLCARGAFELSAKWVNKKPTAISLLSKKGNTVKIKTDLKAVYTDDQIVKSIYENGILTFDTQINKIYTIK